MRVAPQARMQSNPCAGSRVRLKTLTLAIALLAGGCGPQLVGLGAEMAAGGASRGTERVAAGNNPGAGATAAVAAGVGVMAAGYALTPNDQRQAPAPPPGVHTPLSRPPLPPRRP
jgi:hypothetical protein